MDSLNHKEISYNIPKAELHCHIEGTIQPELIIKLAKKHNIEEFKNKTAEDFKEMYKFNSLREFLNVYFSSLKVLRDEEDFEELMFMYLERSASEGLKYAEVFHDVQSLIYKGIDVSKSINGLHKGMLRAQEKYDIKANIIICFIRDSPIKDIYNAFNSILPHKDKIVAIGIASNELDNPPELFQDLYDLARKNNLRTVAHTGEENCIPCEYIYTTLDVLKVERIDHGVQIIKDIKLIEKLAKSQTAITLCPLSNVKLKVFKELKDCPVRLFLDNGLNFCLNSDDPGFSENLDFIGETYYQTAVCFNFSIKDYKILASNSFKAAFISDEEKIKYIKEVEHFLDKFI